MTEIPNWNALFPGCFNADDFAGGLESTVRIKTIVKEALSVIGPGGKPSGEKEDKWVMLFHGSAKMLVLNKTNAALIGAMLGKRTRDWIDKRITLHAEPGCGFGKPGVRVCGSPDIAEDVKTKLGMMPKPNRVYTLRRTSDDTEAPPLGEVIRNAGATREHLDAWLASKKKPTTETITETDADKLRDVLIGPKGAGMLAEIKAMDLTPFAAEGDDGAADFAGDEPGARGEF